MRVVDVSEKVGRIVADWARTNRPVPRRTYSGQADDLGRHLDRPEALARLDALMWNQHFDVADVVSLADRLPRLRGGLCLYRCCRFL